MAFRLNQLINIHSSVALLSIIYGTHCTKCTNDGNLSSKTNNMNVYNIRCSFVKNMPQRWKIKIAIHLKKILVLYIFISAWSWRADVEYMFYFVISSILYLWSDQKAEHYRVKHDIISYNDRLLQIGEKRNTNRWMVD